MRVFWTRGFEAASMVELTEAMRINSPSLCAAFGDKGRLYEEALQRHQDHVGCFVPDALAEEATAQAALAKLRARADLKPRCGRHQEAPAPGPAGLGRAGRTEGPRLAGLQAAVLRGRSTQARQGASAEGLARIAAGRGL